MKLAHVDMDRAIDLDCRKAVEWIIESPAFFQKYIQLLNLQLEGNEGEFVLSEGDVILDISICAEIIMNPFALDFEDRRIQKKLYTELQKKAYEEEMFLATQKMSAELQRYIFELESVCGYDIEAGETIEIQMIFKAFGVKMEGGNYSFSEKIMQYMKIMSELMGKKLLIFVNIRSYLEKDQIQELMKNAVYNEIALLFIENIQRDFSKDKKYYIIDKDGCEIY